MKRGGYLPSTQFSLIVLSLFLSAGLVYGSEALTNPKKNTVEVDKTASKPSGTSDWQQSLQKIQENSGISLPTPPDEQTVGAWLQAAQSTNLTETVSRSLFVNLVNAKGQGLGNDIPTQTQIIEQAVAQIPKNTSAKTYTSADLAATSNSSVAMRAYGNAMMDILIKESNQEFAKTLVILDAATTQSDAEKLALLDPIQDTYERITAQMKDVQVPQNLMPFHLKLVNDFAAIASTYDDMKQLKADPLKGLSAIQQYRSLTQDAGQMFINIAQALDKNDIIFDKNEPGATWSLLLQAQQQTQ